ncbi:efflux RND transporter periplasmic adaptor subunit [Shewanella schlegeliana]|uniref:Efflux RND transporter periplasmic adaptor subunit n=1 Tax=Shewanella schlegeliana TaxID=190308 RepID=A0ABS1T335_9GAMM|nr:efflux RND transporter periplasmic adaptor subunit [Shewanella schlegeliana]MBL4915188.1 efflux RND transporter periplasmic adaptor subunit [Shewanella schlegeliana]MCL1110944.1 efflux RND transporter periplasmic adaptor subunit [Shewanella schlegeliana]GIU29502.1 multidrug resistance protein [Shewanella schlegeliana]
MKHLSKPWLLTTTLVLTTPVLFGCSDDSQEQAQSDVVRPAKIATVVSAAGSVQRSFPAQVSANASTSLAFRVPGQITKRYVTEGKRVEAGTLIAELDPTDFNIHLDDARAKHELAVAQHERNATLVPKGLATKAEFDTSRAEMLMAKANLDRASQNLKYTKIYAPYDGVVAQIHSEDHDHVAATQPIVEFQNDSVSDIQFDLPEKLLKRFDSEKFSELTTQVILDSYPEKPLTATFKEMRKSTSSGALSFRVTLSVMVPDGMRVLPGMSANVQTVLAGDQLGNSELVIAPVGAIFSQETSSLNEGKEFVWVLDGENRTHLREVNVTRLLTSGAVIDTGLKVGDRVIAAGTNHITAMQQVKELQRERGL